jgi:hypothetical protein
MRQISLIWTADATIGLDPVFTQIRRIFCLPGLCGQHRP